MRPTHERPDAHATYVRQVRIKYDMHQQLRPGLPSMATRRPIECASLAPRGQSFSDIHWLGKHL